MEKENDDEEDIRMKNSLASSKIFLTSNEANFIKDPDICHEKTKSNSYLGAKTYILYKEISLNIQSYLEILFKLDELAKNLNKSICSPKFYILNNFDDFELQEFLQNNFHEFARHEEQEPI